ncbi:hypothetical protein [Candidatus Viridilinea mediisalina]|uniref:hypothetical protein n=1 Tax=Candidatus Viridilinea mediisalina TaxID=2024553 RepID=UPI000F59B934|nr:hypothetical protein [Candidatus Viridilinea mediisalina]
MGACSPWRGGEAAPASLAELVEATRRGGALAEPVEAKRRGPELFRANNSFCAVLAAKPPTPHKKRGSGRSPSSGF